MEEQYQLREDFLKLWSFDRIKNINLNEYTNLNKNDSFCYWLESQTTNLGSIWGGSAFKFGIYEKNSKATNFSSGGRSSDDEYAWYSKYGKSREEAFSKIRSIIIEIIELSIAKNFKAIEMIDMGEAIKWKVAYLYSENNLLCVFNRNLLERICESLNIDFTSKDSFYDLQVRLMKNKSVNEDYFTYYNKLIDNINYNSNGKRYWLYAPGENAIYWDEFYENGLMALGWDELEDLSFYKDKSAIAATLKTIYGGKTDKKNDANANYDFYRNVRVGDVIIAKKGRHALLGYGEVLSDYYHDDSRDEFTHCRKIKWFQKGYWGVDESLVLKTFTNITNYISSKNSNLKYYQELLNIMTKEENPNIHLSNLLAYKKQIILQGPPGTGKTKLAKEIAKFMVQPIEQLDITYFKKIVPSLKEIKATNNNHPIDLNVVKDDVMYFNGTKSIPDYNFSMNELYDCFITNDYKKDDYVQYPHYAKRCLVKEVVNTYDKSLISEQCTLVQFHPSYTYEDLVRGIIAESNGDNIEYRNVNKILGKFAEEALKNYNDSRKDTAVVTKEHLLEEYFELYVDDISEKLGKENGFVELTDNVGLVNIDQDAFRYKGKERWNERGNRMLFKDIKRAFLDNNSERQHIKKNTLLSGLARHHSSYYVRVLNDFQKFLNEKELKFDIPAEKIAEKKYVLIIDEINRANLSSVLGELIYALEYRNRAVDSMYEVDGSNKITLPDNLYIIGTMNTADRSVGHIDYAIRRRFAFIDVLPKDLSDESGTIFDRVLFEKITKLFITNYADYRVNPKTVLIRAETLSPEFRPEDIWLGHSYFIDKTKDGGDMAMRLEYEIKPILMEYVKDGILVGEVKSENVTISIEDYIKSL